MLGLIAAGLSNSEIAGRLVIAPKTVRNHVTRIYSKLKADSRAQAVVMAREAGIGKWFWDTGPKIGSEFGTQPSLQQALYERFATDLQKIGENMRVPA